MNKLLRLQATYELLTPAWLGNAQQKAELRCTSLKGLLRFWYRAVEPEFRLRNKGLSREELLFGSAGERGGIGMGSLSLLPLDRPTKTITWNDVPVSRFNDGSGKNMRNGLLYLGFSLKMNQGRDALPAGLSFTLCFDLHPDPRLFDDRPRTRRALRGLAAAFWLLGTLGSMGTRSRRGFGALALKALKLEDRTPSLVTADSPLVKLGLVQLDTVASTSEQQSFNALHRAWQEDLEKLPLLHTVADAQTWKRGLDTTLGQFRSWFRSASDYPASPHVHVPHLGADPDVVVLKQAHPSWEPCLNQLGRAMQDFRLRRAPDYELVKNHTKFVSGDRSGTRLRQAPQRVTFGLPLTFRFSSLPGTKPVQLYSFDVMGVRAHDRHPSPLLLRPIKLPDGLHGLAVRLEGPVPGISHPATLSTENRRLDPPSPSLLPIFMKELRKSS